MTTFRRIRDGRAIKSGEKSGWNLSSMRPTIAKTRTGDKANMPMRCQAVNWYFAAPRRMTWPALQQMPALLAELRASNVFTKAQTP